jgi:hypothetical protein
MQFLLPSLAAESNVFRIQSDLVCRDCFIAQLIRLPSFGVNRAAKNTFAGCVPMIGLPIFFFILLLSIMQPSNLG